MGKNSMTGFKYYFVLSCFVLVSSITLSTYPSLAEEKVAQKSQATKEAGNLFEHRKMTDNEIKIERALDSKFEFSFTEASIEDVAKALESKYNFPVFVNPNIYIHTMPGKHKQRDPKTMKFTFQKKDITLENGLNLMLEFHELSFQIKHDLFYITTNHDRPELDTRIYDCGLITNDAYTMTETLRTAVAPENWSWNGGDGEMTTAGETLVIRADRKTHKQILNFLKRYHHQLKKTNNGKPINIPMTNPAGISSGDFGK